MQFKKLTSEGTPQPEPESDVEEDTDEETGRAYKSLRFLRPLEKDERHSSLREFLFGNGPEINSIDINRKKNYGAIAPTIPLKNNVQ